MESVQQWHKGIYWEITTFRCLTGCKDPTESLTQDIDCGFGCQLDVHGHDVFYSEAPATLLTCSKQRPSQACSLRICLFSGWGGEGCL